MGTHDIALLYSFPINILLKWAYKKTNSIISISNYTKNELLKKFTPKTEVIVINPGIDFEKFYKIPTDLDENFILSVGALKYRKGYHISIPAFALAKKEMPDLKYKIVGSQKDIAYFKHLKDLISGNGVVGDIEFFNRLSDEALSDLYRRAKLFILTSINEDHHFEGFGLVFLEAAAAALPVIGTFGNGIEDAVKDCYNGFLVPQNNPQKTTDAIIKILSDNDLRENLGRNSLKWVKNFSWDKIIKNYIKIYNDSIKHY